MGEQQVGGPVPVLAAQIRQQRHAAGLSQDQLAVLVHVAGRDYISHAERGVRLPSKNLVKGIDQALRADGRLVALWFAAWADKQHRRIADEAQREGIDPSTVEAISTGRSGHSLGAVDEGTDHVAPSETGDHPPVPSPARDPGSPTGAGDCAGTPSTWEDHTDRRRFLGTLGAGLAAASTPGELRLRSLRRVLGTSADSIAGLIGDLNTAVADIVASNDYTTPVEMVKLLARQQAIAEPLLNTRLKPDDLRELYLVCGKLAVVQANAVFDAGDFALARQLCAEAFHFGDLTGHGPLRGFVRVIQSMIEFYDGRPREALAYARDGQRYAPGGAVGARLVGQGEIRAAAVLGDRYAVDAAVDRTEVLLTGLTPQEHGAPGYALETFHPAEFGAYAVTAYRILGCADQVDAYAGRALGVFDAMGNTGFQGMIRLDRAMTLAEAGQWEHACQVVGDVMTLTTERPVDHIGRRVDEFLAVARPHQAVPAVRHVIESSRVWRDARPAALN